MFHEINHPAIGGPPWLWKPSYSLIMALKINQLGLLGFSICCWSSHVALKMGYTPVISMENMLIQWHWAGPYFQTHNNPPQLLLLCQEQRSNFLGSGRGHTFGQFTRPWDSRIRLDNRASWVTMLRFEVNSTGVRSP